MGSGVQEDAGGGPRRVNRRVGLVKARKPNAKRSMEKRKKGRKGEVTEFKTLGGEGATLRGGKVLRVIL